MMAESNNTDVDEKTVFALIGSSEWRTSRNTCHCQGCRELRTVRTKRNGSLLVFWCVRDRQGREKTRRGRGCKAYAQKYIDVILRVAGSDVGARGCVGNGPGSSRRSDEDEDSQEHEIVTQESPGRGRMAEMKEHLEDGEWFTSVLVFLFICGACWRKATRSVAVWEAGAHWLRANYQILLTQFSLITDP